MSTELMTKEVAIAARPAIEPLLRIDGVRVAYGHGRRQHEVVHGIDLEIPVRRIVALVGESGSGKTTIGRALRRILTTSGGEVLYKGPKINGKISRQLDQQVI